MWFPFEQLLSRVADGVRRAGQSRMQSKHVWDGLGMRMQGSLFVTAVDSQPQQLGGIK